MTTKHTRRHRIKLHLAAFSFLLACTGNAQGQVYTVPVVVHVLYTNPVNNISDAQVLDGLDVLNSAFNSLSTDSIPPPFYTLRANMGVNFCLATIAPDGSTTDGIDRIETVWALHGGEPESYMNPWPRSRYLNIWVVGNTDSSYTQGAYRPEQVNADPLKDGIMLRNGFMGTIGTSTPLNAWAIATLAGRYLDLKLLWADPIGGGPCGDDDVADTPPCEEILYCFFDQPSCTPGIPANEQNYMTYSGCGRMFTLGQKDRAIASLNSPVAQRNELWTASNLALTGCGPVGIANIPQQTAFSAFPIPFTDRLEIMGLQQGAKEVELLDLSGRSVGHWITSEEQDGTIEISTGGLASGAYILRIVSAFGQFGKLVQKQ